MVYHSPEIVDGCCGEILKERSEMGQGRFLKLILEEVEPLDGRYDFVVVALSELW
jgi:hypothetical protein